MARRGHRPRKRFSQNFLHDPGIAGKIVAAAGLSPRDVVVELGAGKGFLTKPLARTGVRLIALEIDVDLCGALESELAEEFSGADGAGQPTVELISADLTEVSLTGLLAERGYERCIVIGNIPYHLTREVLFSYLVDEVEVVDRAYLMMQREVGKRVVAAPGGKEYGIPSVILQSLYDTRLLFKVAAGSFVPRPRVDSVVVSFDRQPIPAVAPDDLADFTKLVRSLFQQRRKTLQKTLRSFYSLNEAELQRVASETGIDTDKRPEALSKEEFLKLSRALASIAAG